MVQTLQYIIKMSILAGSSEGKSTTASNLAVFYARTGHKMLLIDADLRKSMQHRIFQVNLDQ